jgi:hypothetical protein
MHAPSASCIIGINCEWNDKRGMGGDRITVGMGERENVRVGNARRVSRGIVTMGPRIPPL